RRVARLRGASLFERFFVPLLRERVDLRLDLLGPGDHGLEQLDRRELARTEKRQGFGRRYVVEVGGDHLSPFILQRLECAAPASSLASERSNAGAACSRSEDGREPPPSGRARPPGRATSR